MNILRVNLKSFRNEEWFQFFTEFRDLARKYTPEQLNIAEQFPAFLDEYNKADEALEFIRKSAETEKMNSIDRKRDLTYRGLKSAVKASRNHYDEAQRQAAHELLIPFDHYGDLASKAPDEETSGLYNFVQEMREKYAPQIAALGLTGWIDELERHNLTYGVLAKTRNIDITSRTKYRMLQVRKDLQEVYRGMIERIEALMLLNANPTLEAFANEWNGFVKKRRDVLAQRKGHK